MASPQVEDGFTKIANEIMDAFCKTRIPGEERQVLDAIFRKTYGWNKCEDHISMGQIATMTRMKRPNVARAIKSLLSKKIALVIKNDNTGINLLKFNKNYEEWVVLSKPITVIKTDNKGVIKYVEKVLSKVIPTKDTIQKTIKYTDDFLSFYNAYPNKKAKIEAFKAWNSLLGVLPDIALIITAIERQKKTPDWIKDGGRFIPHPATWLRAGRWEDETEVGKPSW
jgi:phage replication O-like protein O